MRVTLDNPKAFSEAGRKIYSEKFQKELEESHHGKFAAINVEHEDVTLGDTLDAAALLAREKYPEGQFYLLRVGFPSVGRLPYARTKTTDSDWLFG